MSVWDERKLQRRIEMALKELAQLQTEASIFAEKLSAIEDESDRGDAQRERGEQWSEVVEAIVASRDAMSDALGGLDL
jgi:hypothetical protein